MAEVNVKISSMAYEQLDEIYETLMERSNGESKVKALNSEIFNYVSLLKSNPKMGRRLQGPYRTIIVGNYRFNYHYHESEALIWIVSVFHVNYQQYDNPKNLYFPEE